MIEGVYDGEVVRPLSPLSAKAGARVVIVIPESPAQSEPVTARLTRLGLKFSHITGERPLDFEPVKISGPPLSQAIIEQRADRF